jgi:antitoxin (DNA-binding transcriptional repressor) of toxin-antitoxin stability system
MNETVITIEDAARSLSNVVERVHASGEAALLVKSGCPVARIVAVAAPASETNDLVAFLRQWRLDHPDPDEDFERIIEESRRAISLPRDPWV